MNFDIISLDNLDWVDITVGILMLVMFGLVFVGMTGYASADIQDATNTTNLTGTVDPDLTGINVTVEQYINDSYQLIGSNDTYVDQNGNIRYSVEIYKNKSTRIDIGNKQGKLDYRSTIISVDGSEPYSYDISADVNRSDTFSAYGYITNRSDVNLSDVSVSLKLEGSVIENTTTNSSGYYEFSGLNSSYSVTDNTSGYTVDRVEPAYTRYDTNIIGYPVQSLSTFDPDTRRTDLTYEQETYNLSIDVPSSQVKIGEQTQFTANVSGATGVDSENISYTWFVDTIRQNTTEKVLNYTFQSEGTHQIKLVSDVPNYGTQTAYLSGTENWSETQEQPDVTNLTVEVYNESGNPITPETLNVIGGTLRTQNSHVSTWLVKNLSESKKITAYEDGYENLTKDVDAGELSPGVNKTVSITLSPTTDDVVVVPTSNSDRPITVSPLAWGDYILRIPATIFNVGSNAIGAGLGALGVLGGVLALIAVLGIGSLVVFGGGSFLAWLLAVSKPFRIARNIKRVLSNGVSSITDLFDWF